MSLKPYIALDRDGTIIVQKHYLSDPDAVELLPQATAGLRKMRALGCGLIVVTNQSAIGRGYFDEARLEAIHDRMRTLLAAEDVQLDAIYYCPNKPEDHARCRKPEPGMIEAAVGDFGFEPRASFVIGDKPCDVNLGHRVGATAMLVRTGYGAQHERDRTCEPHYVVDDLLAAAHIIESTLRCRPQGASHAPVS